MKRSKWLCLCSLSLAIFVMVSPELIFAQEKYPTRPIKCIIPFGAGGPLDVICRKLNELVKKSLGQELILENKAGGGGLVPATFLARSKPDGYTLGVLASSVYTTTPIFTKMDFDPFADFTPIVQLTCSHSMISVGVNSTIKTFKDFIEEGRKREISIATAGAMSLPHVAMQLLEREAKIKIRLVPFEGAGQAVMAVMGGQIDGFTGGGMFEYVRGGKLRIIAYLGEGAGDVLKGIPPVKDFGYNIVADTFQPIAGPKGLPDPVQKRLEEEFTRALRDPSFKETTESLGNTLVIRNSKEFTQYAKTMNERWIKAAQELGLGMYGKEKK